MFSWLFKKNEPIITFSSINGEYQENTPVIPAIKCQTSWMKAQKPDKKFQVCPGMGDFANAGYIITAHANIHIKSGPGGTWATVDTATPPGVDYGPQGYKVLDADFVDGMIHTTKSIQKTAGKVPLPWSVKTKKGYSAYALPAFMHSSFLDKIFVYPGLVDYDQGLTAINLMFSPFVECDFTIEVGEPLLHVLPFKREPISAKCIKGGESETLKQYFVIPPGTKHFYKRFLSTRKKFTMECPYKHKIFERE